MVTGALQIGRHRIGDGHPVYVIAEAGVNHNGSLSQAIELVSVAAEAGADAIKFQTFDPKALVVSGADTAAYQRRQTGLTDQKAMLESLALPPEAWPHLQKAAHEAGLDFLSTPFDEGSLDLLIEMGVLAIKLSSGDLTNHRFLRAARASRLPIIASTGASYLSEIESAVAALGGADNLALLHCVTSYPSPPAQSNLLAIRTIADATGAVPGWSDHSTGSETAIASVALGARIIEKHITLDNSLTGPDHAASADPATFAHYVSQIRATERALGDGIKRPQAAERPNRALARRGWYAARDLRAGDIGTTEDFVALRPEAGLPASVDLEGWVLARPILAGEPVTADHIEGLS